MNRATRKRLRELAAKATPGPWHVDGMWDVSARDEDCEPFVIASTEGQQDRDRNAAFIATADPATVTALLDRVDELERALIEAKRRLFLVGRTMDADVSREESALGIHDIDAALADSEDAAREDDK